MCTSGTYHLLLNDLLHFCLLISSDHARAIRSGLHVAYLMACLVWSLHACMYIWTTVECIVYTTPSERAEIGVLIDDF